MVPWEGGLRRPRVGLVRRLTEKVVRWCGARAPSAALKRRMSAIYTVRQFGLRVYVGRCWYTSGVAKKKRGRKKTAATAKKRSNVVSFRADDATESLLEQYVDKMKREQPGGNWSRSSAALNLVTLKLRELDEQGLLNTEEAE